MRLILETWRYWNIPGSTPGEKGRAGFNDNDVDDSSVGSFFYVAKNFGCYVICLYPRHLIQDLLITLLSTFNNWFLMMGPRSEYMTSHRTGRLSMVCNWLGCGFCLMNSRYFIKKTVLVIKTWQCYLSIRNITKYLLMCLGPSPYCFKTRLNLCNRCKCIF